MQWRGRRQSTNIRDVRNQGGGFGGGFGRSGGFGGGMGRGGPVVRRAGGGGIGIIIVIFIVALIFGVNPLELLGGNIGTAPPPAGQTGLQSGTEDELGEFVATVLADTEDTWGEIFKESGQTYREPTLTLFRGGITSQCGTASSASGPFYCPVDENVYIDLAFYDELRSRFGAPGDFAQAYVIAHEVGHHVQKLLGVFDETRGASQQGAGGMSVRTELQADCFAGIWANHTQKQGLLEEGDIDEALTAAAAIGDDTLQRETQGYVVPDSFTHGTSEQRQHWFMQGYKSGDLNSCNTLQGEI